MAAESIKSLIFSEFRELQHRCQDSIKASSEDTACLSKCMRICHGVTSNFPDNISGGQVSYYLQLYAEAILDFTYHDENVLSDADEFPEHTSKDRIANIFAYLDKIRSMCEKISVGSRAEELLGNEIAECILWRKGALLYGYCETVQKDKERLQRGIIEYRLNLQKGIHYLQGLFKIRDAILDSAHVPGENDTLELLKMGIYSSTHLLALMYGGEMCYWFVTTATDATDAERAARNLGEEMLDTYIQALVQIPDLQGWSNDQAKKYLSELKGR